MADASLADEDPRPKKRRKSGKKRRGADGEGGVPKRRSWPLRLVRIGVALTLMGGIAGASTVAGIFIYYGGDPNLPKVETLASFRPKQVVKILDRRGDVIGEVGGEKRTIVPWENIPKLLVDAVVAAEDANYFQHGGLDYRGMMRAFIENVLAGRPVQGGSTITQQLVKTMFLSPERTLRRKVQEIILARELSRTYSKEEVLALYLNQIYYGHGRYGCEEAARYFFGKSVREVDLAEAALLAGLPQSPERLSPRKHPEAAKRRQRYVLHQMVEHGLVDRSTAAAVAEAPIKLSEDAFPGLGVAPEAADVAMRVVKDRLGLERAGELGVTVRTTIDAQLQDLARRALEKGLEDIDARHGYRGPSGHLEGKALAARHKDLAAAWKKGVPPVIEGVVVRVEKDAKDPKDGILVVDVGVEGQVDLGAEARYAPGPKPLSERFRAGDVVSVRLAPERPGSEALPALALELGPQGAMVVMDPNTREVLAMVGGWGYRAGTFNRSARALRQPGSAWKPMVYAAALESKRFTPASVINDAPEVYELWKPSNYEKETFRGPVRLRTALADSINTVAIKLLAEVGVPAGKDMALRLGVTSPIADDIGLSMALGASVVTPLELANVFATFASGGQKADPVVVTEIGGEPIPREPANQVIAPELAFLMTSLLRSVVDEGTARSAATKIKRPAAGKTGTSNGQRDAWFVGYTPDLLVAVWVGFDDMRKLGKGEAGAKTALPVWTDFMVEANKGKPVRGFTQPPGVVVARIDKATGMLAAEGADGIEEVFLDGTAPTEAAPAPGEGGSADDLLLGGSAAPVPAAPAPDAGR